MQLLTSSQIYNAQILIKNLTYREKKYVYELEVITYQLGVIDSTLVTGEAARSFWSPPRSDCWRRA